MSARALPLSKHAVLMIHGLGGTRHDFGSLDRKFEQIGCDVYLPSLPGHGSCPDQLSGVSLRDYMQLLSRTYRDLISRYERVDVAGISMGALLAVMLSARERMTRGRLILLSPPLFLDGWGGSRLRPLRYLMYCVPGLRHLIRVPEGEPFGIKNDRIRSLIRRALKKGSGVHYPYVPLAAIAQVDWMRFAAKRALPRVACETLVMHSLRRIRLRTPRQPRCHARAPDGQLSHDHARQRAQYGRRSHASVCAASRYANVSRARARRS
jgi:carboxylesterase